MKTGEVNDSVQVLKGKRGFIGQTGYFITLKRLLTEDLDIYSSSG